MPDVKFDFSGQVAVVTGASRGIGMAITTGFVEAGARVAMLARDIARLQAAAEPLGDGRLAIPADVAQPTEVEHALRQMLDTPGASKRWSTAPGGGTAEPAESVSLTEGASRPGR